MQYAILKRVSRFLLCSFSFLLISTSAYAGLGASVTLVTGQPTNINPGETTQLEITLSNNNTAAAISGVGFSNSLPGTLPDGLEISGAATYTCTDPSVPVTNPGVGTLTAVVGTQAITLAGGVIPARDAGFSTDGTCTIIIPVTAGTSDGSAQTYNYQIADGAVTGNDGAPVANVGAVNQSVNVLPISRPVVNKSFGSNTLVLGGSETTLTITVTNPNSIALPNFDVTDNFPQAGGSEIIQVANPPNATSNCTGAGVAPTFTPLAGDLSVSATGGTVAANESCTVTVDVEARQTNGVYQTGFVANTIDGGTDFDNDLGVEPLDASANVRTRSPLNVAKSFGSAAVASGQTGTFSIVFINTGDAGLTVNSFTDDPIDGTVGTGFGLVMGSAPTIVCSDASTATTVLLNAGDGFQLGGVTPTFTIPASGGTCTISGSFTATSQTNNVPQSFTNTIAQGAVGTTTPGIVSQARSASILVADELRVLKAVSPTNPAPGNPVRYQVTVQNFSNSIINNIDIDDTFTNGQTFLTGVINGNDFTPSLSGAGCVGLTTTAGTTGSAAATLEIGTLPARIDAFTPAACVVTFYSMTDTGAANGSNVNNVIGAGDVCFNAGVTCNGSASNSTSSSVDSGTITADKAFSPAGPLPENAISTMTITLTNLSANEITSATISDSLPAANVGTGQLTIASPPNAATTCGGTPTITAVAGTTSITLNNANIPARASNGTGAAGTCTLQVDVTGAAGVYDNTATAAGTETFGDGITAAIGPVNSNTEQITFTSSLSAAKSFNPSSVSSGGKSTVTVRLDNGGSIPITGLSLTDPLPAGMTLANPVNAQTSCAGMTAFTGNAGDSSITMTGAEIAGNGSCDVLFDVVATGAADWTNTIPVGNIAATGGVANQTAVTDVLMFAPPTGITVAKATSPSTLTSPGLTSQLTVTLTNGTTPVTGLTFTDYFTADGTMGATANGMRIASTPNASTTCSGGIVSATPDDTEFSVSGVSLGASASCTVTVDVTSIVIGGITNFIPIGGLSTDQGLTNSGAATTSLTTQGNLGVTKKFTPNVIEPGERSVLRITFLNPTSQPAVNVGVTDTLPANVTVPVGAASSTTCSGATLSSTTGTFTVSGANLSAASGGVAESCYSEIEVTSVISGDYTNTIPIGGVTGTIGGVIAQNSQPATDILRVKQPLVINKAIGGFTLDAGNPVGFTTGGATRAIGASAPLVISITNPNAAALTQATLTDTLPSGLVIAQTPNTSTTCAGGVVSAVASSNSVTLTNATIPGAGACTFTVDVLSNITGTYTNTIPTSAVSTLEGVTNEEPTSAEIMISSPPTVRKEFSPAAIPSGGTSTMTIFFTNDNASAMTLSSVFTDTLPTAPGPVQVAGTPNVVTSCPGAVTAVAGAGTVSYANGAQIPSGGCEINVDVTAATAGVHTNNIPAGELQTDFGNNPDPANAELTVTTLGYISGRVFQDNTVTPNGTYEPSTDDPLAGETIELRSGATCAGALVATTTTSATGGYIFTNLAAGTYSVCQPSQPASTVNSITTAGGIVSSNGSTGTVGSASNPTATSSQITSIVLNGDGGGGEVSGSTGNDFAEVVQSSISGRVFLDQNNNGVQNGADTAISGVSIELLDNVGAVIATTTTDASGDYSFTNLDPDTYSVREPTQPANTSNGQTIPGTVGNGGTDGTGTVVGVTPSEIATIILPPNTAANDNNFAELPNDRTIRGNVFLDYDNNAALDGVDYGLSGVTINLTGPVNTSVVTDANGDFSFTGLPEGTYQLDQAAQPTGTTNGTTTGGTNTGVASNPTATTSRIATIDLTGSNILSAGNLFPEIPTAAVDLTIAKSHAPASFAAGSSSGTFILSPSNIGAAASSGTITITDTLPAGLTLASVPAGTGWSCGGSVGASSFTCTTTDVIGAASAGNNISFRVLVAPGATGQLLTNTAVIAGGNEPPGFDGNNTAMDTVGISTVATVSGTVWRDIDHDRVLDVGEPRVSGWTVELLFGGSVVDSQTTAADGTYTLSTVSPGSGYEIRFREPTTGLIFGNAVTNERGTDASGVANTRDTGGSTANDGSGIPVNPAGADTTVTTGTLQNLTILAGDNIIEQSLPIDPAGVVYNAVTRDPVQGAVVTITGPGGFTPATDLVGGASAQNVTTGTDGFYQFLLTPAAPTGNYTLTVTTYPGGFVPLPSTLIPGCTGTLTVDAAPDPALVHDSANPPDAGDAIQSGGACPANTGAITPGDQATTQHYFTFFIDTGLPSGNVVNNHIPLDPIASGDIVLTKTTPIVNTNIGQIVPYTITATNTSANNLTDLDVIDVMPAGFKYVEGSASLDGAKLEPAIQGRNLTWSGQDLNAGQAKIFKLMLVVGSGVQPGEYDNRAQVFGSGTPVSNLATASVRVIPDPVFDCSDIIGKVFDDENKNGYQDKGEAGIANVRLATVNGLLVTTDDHGRFHVACADIPDEERGSNFLMKLDERTLPTGYRVTTENPRAVRMTRGKMTKLNFGASIHCVVRIDMMDDAFVQGEIDLKPEWLKQLRALPEHLKSGPSVVRFGYEAGGEGEDLARDRLRHVVEMLRAEWEEKDCCHEIVIEEELILPPSAITKGGAR